MAIAELEPLIHVFTKKYGTQLGDGLTAATFLDHGRVKKIYSHGISKKEVFKEAYIMSCVEEAGISAPHVYEVVWEEGYWVMTMTYIKGRPLLEVINDALDKEDGEEAERLIIRMAEKQAEINTRKAAGLPDYKSYAREVILNNPNIGSGQKKRLAEYLGSLPEDIYICHGDLHPNNYLIDETQELTAIDWPEVGGGVPACDAARTYLNLCHPALIRNTEKPLNEVFMETYCKTMGIRREEVERWLPVHAGMLVGYKKPDFSEVVANYLI